MEKYGYSGKMIVSDKKNPRKLHKHQVQALKALNKTTDIDHHKGLLVIPTGGGKTFTAVYYILNQIINNNKKVLWIAHRHELLNQTLDTVAKAKYKEVLPNRDSFRYRVISGKHDRPVNIEKDDDILIASKDSLIRGCEYLEKWIVENEGNICLVIDEAHHAVAKTYRTIINLVEKNSDKWSKVLGLTATPIRTAENEKGLLKKIFKDDITYSIDLKTLISLGILAKPYFDEINTDFTLKKDLTAKELEFIRRSGNLPENIAENIVKNAERNNKIVEEYVKNKVMYGKTLVFAINILHAIQLNKLFKENGIKSDYVVSSLKDAGTGVTISAEENAKKIKAFRNGDLDILINVNILTEGTDIPNIQSIFLTRQTTSEILLNQMIGRGLRGVKAGGTAHANIISFIDNWKYKINWISPKDLPEYGEFVDGEQAKRKYEKKYILIKLIEDFTIKANKEVDSSTSFEYVGKYKPLGGYKFTLIAEDEDEIDKDCTIIVYDNLGEAFEEFLKNIKYVFKNKELLEYIESEDFTYLAEYVENEFFAGYDLFGYNKEDIVDLLKYYYAEGSTPNFTELEIEITKSDESVVYDKDEVEGIIVDDVKFENLSLAQIRKIDEVYWRKLRNEVFENSRDEDGHYVSATGLYKSDSKWFFQIDHIKPMSKGGKTVIDNLQILTRWENQIKGDKDIDLDDLKRLVSQNGEESSIGDLEERLRYSYFDEDNIEKTKELIKMIQSKDEENIEAYRILADIKLIEEKYRGALIFANKALKINEQDFFAMYVKGEAYYNQEKYNEAIKWFEMALREMESGDHNLYTYLGDCYFNIKKKEISLTYYEKALELVGDEKEEIAYLEYMLGAVYFSKRKYDIALSHYKRSLEYDEKDANVYNCVGVCYERLKNNSDALKYFYKAYELDSKCSLYLKNIRNIKGIDKEEINEEEYLGEYVAFDEDDYDEIEDIDEDDILIYDDTEMPL